MSQTSETFEDEDETLSSFATEPKEQTIKFDGRRKPRTEKQIETLRKMREIRQEKRNPKEELSIDPFKKQMADLNTVLIYDMEKRRQSMKKDNKWSSLIDKKFTTLEQRLTDLFQNPVTKTEVKKRKAEEELQEIPLKKIKEIPKTANYGIKSPFDGCGSSRSKNCFV